MYKKFIAVKDIGIKGFNSIIKEEISDSYQRRRKQKTKSD